MVKCATYNTLHDVFYFTVLLAFIHCERSQQQYLYFCQYTKIVLAKAQQEMEYRKVIALFCKIFFALFAQAGLPPESLRNGVLHHNGHVLRGGAARHQWPASGC